MKKSVILIIMAVYVLSVCIVGFFGIKVLVYDEIVYVSKVEIASVWNGDSELEIMTNDEGEKYAFCQYREGIVVQIKYRVFPDNVTDKKVRFVYDEDNKFASVSQTGAVSFRKAGSVTVTLKPADGGSGTADSILILAL